MRWIGRKVWCAATSAGARLTEVFTFRPAPLRAAQDWRLDGNTLTFPRGSYDLAEVEDAVFVDSRIQFMRLRRLDLTGPAGLCRIAINTRLGLSADDPNRAAHRALCQAVARQLAKRAPDPPVKLGETGGMRILWFCIGMMALVFSFGLGAAALATGVSSDRLAGMVVPLLVLALFGGVIVWRHALWRKLPQTPVSALPGLLDAMDGSTSPAQDV